MNRALVIGATGSIGYAIVKELVNRKTFQIAAFARTKSKLEQFFGGDSNVVLYPGDVFNIEELRAVAQNAGIIFHALNVPYYEWEAKQPVLLNNILSVTKEANARLVVVDSVYAYGRVDGEKVREDFPKQPHTKKGKIRLELENMIKQSGVQFIIAHFPDFYGPYVENTLLHETFKRVVQNKKTIFVGNPDIPREFIYTPDGAKALVELSLRNHTYGQNWNVPGAGLITGNEILQILRKWGYSKGMTTVNQFMIRMAGLFNKLLREYVEMYYLNEHPVVLAGEKLEKELGRIPRTPYETGITNTLAALQSSAVLEMRNFQWDV